MAAPVGKNYLSSCKAFLKEFTATINPNDPLPVKLTGYNIEDVDVEGEIIDWTLQYLNQKSCPQSLANTITQSVLNEMQAVVKDDHELRVYSEDRNGVQYDPIKLMHSVIAKVNIVCERLLVQAETWDENDGPCPQLPPPAPGPPFVSTYAIKNHRRKMEDRHVAIDDLHSLFNVNLPGQVGYYAIFDGHNGHEAAAYSSAQLHGLVVHSKHYPKDPEAALRDAFLRADEIFINKCAMSQKLMSGTTALVALLRPKKSLHVGWLGDSLGILVRSGGKVIQLVEPHTAERIDERRRIEDAGGVVIMHFSTWRINGTLSISRAIGDPDCKPHVSAVADVVTHQLDGTDHFLILACDGLWDSVTSEEAAAFVYEQLRQDPANYSEIGKGLVNLAKNRASSDNISVVVVLLSPIEDILATAPPSAQEALFPSDVPLCSPPHLVNGAMDGAQFDSIHKVPSPEGAIDLTARNGLHYDNIMMSSFYGAEDGKDIFSNPCDLGPETDVDLLDDDAGMRTEQKEPWCERVANTEEPLESVKEKEDLESGGGVEEEEDDSEDEDAEWKYVSVKSPGSGVVPVSPEPPADERAPSGHEIDPPGLLDQSVEAEQQVIPPDSGFLEAFSPSVSAREQELDENKVCPELNTEELGKSDNQNLFGDISIEGLQNPILLEKISAGDCQELIGESKELSEEAAMESRLNPDAAEFVPISPTRAISETLNSVGNEFDMFRKEAEACPGEVCDEMSSLPTEIVGRPIYNDDVSKMAFDKSELTDADVVLSSSFNYEHRNTEVMDYLGSPEDAADQDSYHLEAEDEDKENIPVCDDKENMSLSPNPELVPAEDMLINTQERELERLEETIYENVSGTTDTSDLQFAGNISSVDASKEKMEFDQRFPENEMQKSELVESSDLMVDDQYLHSPELPKAVEQTYELESNLIQQKEEDIVQLDDKYRSEESQEDLLKSVPEKELAFGEPIEAHQNVGKVDFQEFEQELYGRSENNVMFAEQDIKQDFMKDEQNYDNVSVPKIEEDLVQENENKEKIIDHDLRDEDFEIIPSSREVEELNLEKLKSQEVCFTPEKLSNTEFEEDMIEQIHERPETQDSIQKAFEDIEAHDYSEKPIEKVESYGYTEKPIEDFETHDFIEKPVEVVEAHDYIEKQIEAVETHDYTEKQIEAVEIHDYSEKQIEGAETENYSEQPIADVEKYDYTEKPIEVEEKYDYTEKPIEVVEKYDYTEKPIEVVEKYDYTEKPIEVVEKYDYAEKPIEEVELTQEPITTLNEVVETLESTRNVIEDEETSKFIQKEIENLGTDEIIPSEVLSKSTPEHMTLNENIINLSDEPAKHETEFQEEIQVTNSELLSNIEEQMNNLAVCDEPVTEKYQEIVELTHSESDQRPFNQLEDKSVDELQANLSDLRLHNEGEQYQVEIEQEFQVKSSEELHADSFIETSTKIVEPVTEVIPPSISQPGSERLSPSEELLSPSAVPETIPTTDACPESLIAESPELEPKLLSEIQTPSVVAEQIIEPVQEEVHDLSVTLEHETKTPEIENIVPAINLSTLESEIEVKDEPVTAEVSPVVQSPSEAVPAAVIEQIVEKEVVKENTETPKIADVIPPLPLDAKSPAKKTPLADKKKTLEKSKAPATTASKGKPAARSSVPPRTNLTAAKTSALSPTKSSATKPAPTERKTASPAVGKPSAPSKSTSAPLSSKPRTSTTKAAPVPASKSTPPVKSSTTASRPATAPSKPASTTGLSKPASTVGTSRPATASRPSSAGTALKSSTAASKPASASAKSTTTQSKVTEVKRAVNGDASKPLSQSSAAAPKPAARKVPLSSSTAKATPSLTKTSAKPASTASKAASDTTKPKPQLNGTASKPSRPVNTAASKPPTSLSAQARKPLSKASPSTVSDPKKAKESANKHISATRSSTGAPGARRSTDLKGSLASKTAAAKSRPSETKAPLSNGTTTEKALETLNEVEGKIDLMIKENGVDIVNDIRKEEEVTSQEMCMVKEQVMLIVEEGVREAM